MPEKTELTWTTEHSASSYNMGVLVDGTKGDLFDGFLFRYYRDTFGAWIETNRPKKVRMTLRTPRLTGARSSSALMQCWREGGDGMIRYSLPDSLEYRLSDEDVVFAVDRSSRKVFRVDGDNLVEISDSRTRTKVDLRMRPVSKERALDVLLSNISTKKTKEVKDNGIA